MPRVVITSEKGFEAALRDFHRKVNEQGIVREIKRRAFFVPAAEARKLKSIEARKRNHPRPHVADKHTPKAPGV